MEYFEDEIVEIEYIGEQDTIDINTSGNRLFYANDILTHNSAMEQTDHEMHHIAGGISKINTADNVMTIFTSEAMKERGEYRLQFIKTRSSAGVGKKLTMLFDTNSLRVTDMPDDYSPSINQTPTSISDIGESLRKKSKVIETPEQKKAGFR